MRATSSRKYLLLSILVHSIILLLFIINIEFFTPLPVLENTNQQDIISAVVLGDSPKSKILPQKLQEEPLKEVIKPSKPKPAPTVDKDTIALKASKKKLAEEKLRREFLADLKKQKQLQQKKLQAQFKKKLREQAEQSLRQQLLNEDIKLKASESRQSQGEINKYKALILQAISENWLIPSTANKKRYCELRIRLAPGGMVLDVQVTKTSGDPALDSSARAAVFKASPLPVPKETKAFESFRQFVLKVKPENIL